MRRWQQVWLSRALKKTEQNVEGTDDLSVPFLKVADCSGCRFRDRREQGICEPGDACVMVESGRQIDRFFRNNPQESADYLQDPFWERRAIAVRYAPADRLPILMRDEDEVVRRAVAYRLSLQLLNLMSDDSDREVRITVADRLPPHQLESMIADRDYLVRVYVARRLPLNRLFRMTDDPEPEVRKTVAGRLEPHSLRLLREDKDAAVRRIVVERSDPADAVHFIHDEDWLVRYLALEKVPVIVLNRFRDDADPEVRKLVGERLGLPALQEKDN